jgi:hypothetical protein
MSDLDGMALRAHRDALREADADAAEYKRALGHAIKRELRLHAAINAVLASSREPETLKLLNDAMAKELPF